MILVLSRTSNILTHFSLLRSPLVTIPYSSNPLYVMLAEGIHSTPLPTQSSMSTPAPAPPPPTTSYSWRSHVPKSKMLYIRNITEANREVARLQTGPVGFDLEWKPNFRKGEPENPVALVQIANQGAILLIQVSAMQEFPKKLQELLENPDIIKAGVGIQNDVKKLYNDYSISTRNCVDLSLLARSVDNARWKGKYTNPLGLARLVETYEQSSLPKGKITRSNWEDSLNQEQQEYAANDAHAGYAIYLRLMAISQAMASSPQATCYTFDFIRGRLCEPSGRQWFAHNPNYDPGPPPPPKLPKAPKAPKASDVTIVGSSTTTASASSIIPPVVSRPSGASDTRLKRPYHNNSLKPRDSSRIQTRNAPASHFPQYIPPRPMQSYMSRPPQLQARPVESGEPYPQTKRRRERRLFSGSGGSLDTGKSTAGG